MDKFYDKRTEKLFRGDCAKGIPVDIAQRAHNRLRIVARMTSLDDLRLFPGMRPEPLKGNRKGQYSIRVNDQWRICFVWNGQESLRIEFVDYH